MMDDETEHREPLLDNEETQPDILTDRNGGQSFSKEEGNQEKRRHFV